MTVPSVEDPTPGAADGTAGAGAPGEAGPGEAAVGAGRAGDAGTGTAGGGDTGGGDTGGTVGDGAGGDGGAVATSAADAGPDQEPDGEPGEEAGDEPDAEDLFQQSEIAADYLEGLLDVLDLDGDIDELVAAGRPVVEVVGGQVQSLVGQRGATLEALQDLARLAVFRQTGESSRLLIDIGGYRANRRNELGAVARNAVERVREHGEPVRLEPMSAFERKCVHDVINATDGVVSESEGVEPDRRVLVRPE